MSNTSTSSTQLKSVLSDHFFDITDSNVTNIQQDPVTGNYVFQLTVHAAPRRPEVLADTNPPDKKPGGGPVMADTNPTKKPGGGTTQADTNPPDKKPGGGPVMADPH